MSFETTKHVLALRLAQLQEVLGQLEATLSDRPDDLALLDRFEEATSDTLGAVGQALDVVSRHASGSPEVGRLSLAGRCMETAQRHYMAELAGLEPLAALRRATQRRGRAWTVWFSAFTAAVDRCRDPLLRADAALHDCLCAQAESAQVGAANIQSITIHQPASISENAAT